MYTAIVWVDNEEVDRKTGEEVDRLYAWILANAENSNAHYQGKIIDNESEEVIRTFCMSSID